MYIISETFPDNDARVIPGVERLYQHWMYTSWFVPDELKLSVDLEEWGAIEVSEDVAKAMKFGNTNKGRIGIRTGTKQYQDVFMSSTEADGEKTYYYLTEEDQKHGAECLKTEMILYLEYHYRIILSEEDQIKFANKKKKIYDEINSCVNILQCQLLMHKRFGVECSNLAKTEYSLGSARFDLSTPGADNFPEIRPEHLKSPEPVPGYNR